MTLTAAEALVRSDGRRYILTSRFALISPLSLDPPPVAALQDFQCFRTFVRILTIKPLTAQNARSTHMPHRCSRCRILSNARSPDSGGRRNATAAGPGRASAAAFRAAVELRLASLEREVGELKGRLNGLIFVVLGAVITQVVLRLVA